MANEPRYCKCGKELPSDDKHKSCLDCRQNKKGAVGKGVLVAGTAIAAIAKYKEPIVKVVKQAISVIRR